MHAKHDKEVHKRTHKGDTRQNETIREATPQIQPIVDLTKRESLVRSRTISIKLKENLSNF